MFQDAKEYDEVFDCIMVTKAKKNDELLCNPIYHFTDDDVWQYIRQNNVIINPLYEKGYKRVGCILCPLANYQAKMQEAKDYPTYKRAYINAFNKMLEKRRKDGLKTEWKDGEDVFEWWIRSDSKTIKNQMTIYDFMKGAEQ